MADPDAAHARSQVIKKVADLPEPGGPKSARWHIACAALSTTL
ncbi:MAG: hypothetical protein ACREEM_50645 [Blastocatellia bacterium]